MNMIFFSIQKFYAVFRLYVFMNSFHLPYRIILLNVLFNCLEILLILLFLNLSFTFK